MPPSALFSLRETLAEHELRARKLRELLMALQLRWHEGSFSLLCGILVGKIAPGLATLLEIEFYFLHRYICLD